MTDRTPTHLALDDLQSYPADDGDGRAWRIADLCRLSDVDLDTWLARIETVLAEPEEAP